jgi:transcriptional pleiotropic repressor
LDTLHAARNVVLLDNTRKIEKLIHNNDTGKVVFNDICKVMSEILQAHILVISKKGKVLGVGECKKVNAAHGMIVEEIGTFVDPELNTRLLDVLSTHENVALQTLGFFASEDKDLMGIVLPIEVAGERLGTVFIYKDGEHFDIDDIILSEYGTTVVGLEMLRAVSEENAEENRKIAVVKSAISTLSYTEMHAIIHIFEELDGVEGILVASKIADKAGITRSVVVNALRKFESAGVIESRSSGMKGTYIKVLNDAIYGELAGLRKQIQP